MTNREWLNGLSDEDFCTALEQVDCKLCAFYGDCRGKQCHDGFIEWLKMEHEDDDKYAILVTGRNELMVDRELKEDGKKTHEIRA